MNILELNFIDFLSTDNFIQLLVTIITIFIMLSIKTLVTSIFDYIRIRMCSDIISEGKTIRMHNNTGYSDGLIVHVDRRFITVEVYNIKSEFNNDTKYLHHTSYIPTAKFFLMNWSVIYTGYDKKFPTTFDNNR